MSLWNDMSDDRGLSAQSERIGNLQITAPRYQTHPAILGDLSVVDNQANSGIACHLAAQPIEPGASIGLPNWRRRFVVIEPSDARLFGHEHHSLGVQLVDEPAGPAASGSAILVGQVEPQCSAFYRGLRPGQMLLAINGIPAASEPIRRPESNLNHRLGFSGSILIDADHAREFMRKELGQLRLLVAEPAAAYSDSCSPLDDNGNEVPSQYYHNNNNNNNNYNNYHYYGHRQAQLAPAKPLPPLKLQDSYSPLNDRIEFMDPVNFGESYQSPRESLQSQEAEQYAILANDNRARRCHPSNWTTSNEQLQASQYLAAGLKRYHQTCAQPLQQPQSNNLSWPYRNPPSPGLMNNSNRIQPEPQSVFNFQLPQSADKEAERNPEPDPDRCLRVRRTLRVRIKKSKPILGIAIEGGFNVSGQLVPRILFVHEGGAAYECGKLRASDLILEINRISTANMTHKQIAETIANAYYQDPRPHIEFLIGESIPI